MLLRPGREGGSSPYGKERKMGSTRHRKGSKGHKVSPAGARYRPPCLETTGTQPKLLWFVGTEFKFIQFALRPFDWGSLVFGKACEAMAGCQMAFQCSFELQKLSSGKLNRMLTPPRNSRGGAVSAWLRGDPQFRPPLLCSPNVAFGEVSSPI